MYGSASPRFFRFGPNVLDSLRGVLWQDGVQVPLTPRVFDILTTLVERHGELVTKDDFMRLVWGGVAVEDNNLARQISTLRKLLHERPGQREYIATVTGVGYRFVGTVTASDEVPACLSVLVDASPSPADPSPHVAPSSVAGPEVTTLPTSLPAPPAAGNRWAMLALAMAALAAALVSLAWPDEVTSAAPVRRTLSQFTHDSGSQFDPAWSPDGTRLALVSDQKGNADIWVHGIAGSTAVQLTTSPAHDRQPHWSPDGRSIVFRSERAGGGLYIVDAAGGPERQLTSFGATPRWSPVSDEILFTQIGPDASVAVKLFVIAAGGGTPRRVTHPALAGLQVTNAAWAPDGRLSVWAHDTSGGRRFLTFPLDDGPATASALPPGFTTTEASPRLGSFAWAPSGRHIYFEGKLREVRNVWRVHVNPTTLDWIGAPEHLTLGPGADVGLSVSPDGSSLSFAVNTARSGIWSFGFDPAAGRITSAGSEVVSGDSGERGADLTRDGHQIAYRLDRGNRQEIWSRQVDGEPRLLVSESGWDVSVPKWSPDNSRIVYRRRSRPAAGSPARQSVVMHEAQSATGQSVEILRHSPDVEVIPADWRADGEGILAACRLTTADQIGTCEINLPPAGAAGVEATLARVAGDDRHALYQQRYSPNQRWISFIAVPRDDRSTSTVYVMPRAGGVWHPITDGGAYDDKPRWSPDGRVLYFLSNRDGRFEVWGRRIDPEAGMPAGQAFRVTSLEGARQTLSPYLTDLEMFVTRDALFLPMLSASSRIWILDNADR